LQKGEAVIAKQNGIQMGRVNCNMAPVLTVMVTLIAKVIKTTKFVPE